MKFLKDGDFKNKIVLVRCDFNVALDAAGNISDDFRIVKALPTIKFLAKKGAVLVLMSHMEKNGQPASLKVVAKRLEKLLLRQITFLSGCSGKNINTRIKTAKPGQIILLENLRFHAEEKTNDIEFAKQIARMGDCYVNEAFSASHRRHASIVSVPKYLPSYAGLLFEDEVVNLSKIIKDPSHPFVVIIGGAKVGTKSKMIANIAPVADHILVGSKIGEKILEQKNQLMGRHSDPEEPFFDAIDLTSSKIHLPIDGMLVLKGHSEGYLRTAAIGNMRTEEDIYDIGPETIKFFSEIIREAKTVFFNGPVGLFEKPEFSKGTKAILESISRAHNAYRVAGGGETLEAIHKYKMQNCFDFLSTGGGAMLEFLAGDKLPGIEALDSSPSAGDAPVPDSNVPLPPKRNY
ncbi:MAG: phosphoglycerate kinase [Candidatus Paceibacterota bacterium]